MPCVGVDYLHSAFGERQESREKKYAFCLFSMKQITGIHKMTAINTGCMKNPRML